MHNTIVIQSHQQSLPIAWLKQCIETVESWADINQYDYEFIGDEFFDYLTTEILDKTKTQRVIASDLARLKALQDYLGKNYETVVWCDADFIIFSPDEFKLPNESYALGREVWIQEDDKNPKKLVAHTKVHNAFMMFRQANTFLDFYTESAERLLTQNKGSMPPQFIGPKLLTAIHNVVQCPILEAAGMLSPLVVKDITKNGGQALELFKKKSPQKIHAANVCSSLYERGEYTMKNIESCLERLLCEEII